MKPYCFQYDEHNIVLVKEFFNFYVNNTLTDVNIHVEGKCIAAHKTILAAASPFLRSIFRTRKDTDLHFEELRYESMKALIEYMYNGCLIVEYKYLTECLQLADSFKVRGISALYCDDTFTEPGTVSEQMQKIISELMSKRNFLESEDNNETPLMLEDYKNCLQGTSSLPKLQLKRNASTGKWIKQNDLQAKTEYENSNIKCKTVINSAKRTEIMQNAKEKKRRKMENPKKFDFKQIEKLNENPNQTSNSLRKNGLTSFKEQTTENRKINATNRIGEFKSTTQQTTKKSTHVAAWRSTLIETQNQRSLQAFPAAQQISATAFSNESKLLPKSTQKEVRNRNWSRHVSATKLYQNSTASKQLASASSSLKPELQAPIMKTENNFSNVQPKLPAKPIIQPIQNTGFRTSNASNLTSSLNHKQTELKPAQHVTPFVRTVNENAFKSTSKADIPKSFIRRPKVEPRQAPNSNTTNMQHYSQVQSSKIVQKNPLEQRYEAPMKQTPYQKSFEHLRTQTTLPKPNSTLNQTTSTPFMVQSQQYYPTSTSAPTLNSMFYTNTLLVQQTGFSKPTSNTVTDECKERSLFSPELSPKYGTMKPKVSPMPAPIINTIEPKKELKRPKKTKKTADTLPLKQQYDVLFGEDPPKEHASMNNKTTATATGDAVNKNSTHNRVSDWHVDESDVFECDGEYEQHKNDPCPQPEELIKKERRVYGCPACNKAYTLKSNYRRHYVINHKRLDIAVYKCPMCESRFTRTDNRNQHIRKIHGFADAVAVLSWDQPFHVCQMCKKGFTQEHELNRHTQMVHMNSYPMYL